MADRMAELAVIHGGEYNDARDLTIVNADQYEAAGAFLVDIRRRRKDLKAEYEELATPQREALRVLQKKFKGADEPLAKADDILMDKTRTWWQEQKAARAAADAESLAVLAKAIEDDDLEKVAEVIETAEKPEPKAAGISYRTTWSAQILDLRRLCMAIATGDVSVDLVTPDMKRLNAMARANREMMNVPGVKAVPKTTQQVRTG